MTPKPMLNVYWTPAELPYDRAQLVKHLAAVCRPRGKYEAAIVHGVTAWCDYARAHFERYEDEIGKDHYTATHWAAWGRALLALLNCETGRLDCGTLHHIITENLKTQGLEND